MDPRIQIQILIYTKMSWIRNTAHRTRWLSRRLPTRWTGPHTPPVSGFVWIRIVIGLVVGFADLCFRKDPYSFESLGIRIRTQNTDPSPDPGVKFPFDIEKFQRNHLFKNIPGSRSVHRIRIRVRIQVLNCLYDFRKIH